MIRAALSLTMLAAIVTAAEAAPAPDSVSTPDPHEVALVGFALQSAS